MGKKSTFHVIVSEEVKEEFYKTVGAIYGVGKGRLSQALEEALKDWIEKKKREKERDKTINEIVKA